MAGRRSSGRGMLRCARSERSSARSAILPVYGIGKRVGRRASRCVRQDLMALNPFLVWYSQEARMFMWVMMFALVGMYGILRIFDCGFRIGSSGPR